MYKNYIVIIFLIVLTSCDFDKPNWPIEKNFDPKDESAIVLIDKETCKLPSNDNLINDSLLIGVWEDSASWLHEKDCIYSVDFYNKSASLNLRKSKRCIFKTKTPKSENIGDGVYWTKNLNDSNFLFLAFNSNNDTIFDQGDTMYMKKYYVNYFDSISLYLTPFEVTNREFDEKTTQLKRIK